MSSSLIDALGVSMLIDNLADAFGGGCQPYIYRLIGDRVEDTGWGEISPPLYPRTHPNGLEGCQALTASFDSLAVA